MDKIEKYILIDRNIPHAEKLFCGFQRIEFFDPVEGIDKVEDLEQVEVLINRSTLKVNRFAANKMPRLELIGTATAGQDHIHVKRDKIHVISAPGCNAEAVCDYVFYSLFSLNGFMEQWFQNLKFGIVGFGNVGARVWNRAKQFGFQTVLVDPPLEKRMRKFTSAPFSELFNCDIISLHVPLTTQGEYPTAKMIGKKFFDEIKPKAVFLNTSRGEVVDEEALMRYHRKLGGLILDVYQKEPTPNADLMKIADIATPHIAGHTHQAFYRGSLMVARHCYLYFKRQDLASKLEGLETVFDKQEHRFPVIKAKPMDKFRMILKTIFDIKAASEITKKRADSFTAASFAQLRSQLRREENRFITLSFDPSEKSPVQHLLTNMDFTLKNNET